mgnify:CR=1 FL=1
MKQILAIETSAEACSVALADGDAVKERFEHAPMKHAELILPMVSGLLGEAGLKTADLDVIAFGRGPGSFTSLRIGIGVVQGLAWGADIPVVPVSSLAAVAQAALGEADGRSAGQAEVLVAMDARMGEVFHGRFRPDQQGRVESAGPEQVSAPGDVIFAGVGIAAGNGFDRYDELAAQKDRVDACFTDIWPRASTVLQLARHWLETNEAIPAALAQPVYIRNDVAQKPAQGAMGR